MIIKWFIEACDEISRYYIIVFYLYGNLKFTSRNLNPDYICMRIMNKFIDLLEYNNTVKLCFQTNNKIKYIIYKTKLKFNSNGF